VLLNSSLGYALNYEKLYYNFNWSGTLVESYCERALKGDFGFVKELKAQGDEQDNGKLFLTMA
jgi:hypothetical protein